MSILQKAAGKVAFEGDAPAAFATAPVTRARVEQIRALMTTRLPGGKGVVIRTHKNSFACALLDFIDQHLPNDI